jgi:hypothetical protein
MFNYYPEQRFLLFLLEQEIKRFLSAMTNRLLFTILLGLAAYPIAANADIYSSKDEQGNSVFSDQNSSTSKTVKSSGTANYYTPLKVLKTVKLSPKQTLPTTESQFSAGDEKEVANDHGGKILRSESKCQQEYSLSCDKIVNWKKYAVTSCGNDSRCDDEEYLTRKYKPLPTQALLNIARRSAIRNNRGDDEITHFLKRKYTNYCENQASMSCSKDDGCNQKILDTCKDPRSIEDIFSKYNNLSISEKKKIIKQAQALAISNNTDQQSYKKKIADLLSLLVTRTLLGF